MSHVNRMSSDEMRYWMRELHVNHGWTWAALARTLGIGLMQHAASKVRGNSWFYRSEQKRCSRQLDRIISGELVLGPPNRHGRRDAVLAEHPVPLEKQQRMRFNLKTMQVEWVPRRPIPPAPLPGFKAAIEAFR